MKTRLFLIPLILIAFSANSQSKKQCGFGPIHEKITSAPDYEQRQLLYKKQVKELQNRKSDTVIVIPVVVHVLYKNATENISMAQIQSQLDVLNEDFRKQNADTTNVASGFSKADVKLEFALAKLDPQGNATTGVTRTSTTIDNIGNTSQYYSLVPAWNHERYLNIWVCDVGDVLLGFAYPPNTPGVSPQEDGVVIGFEYFGTTGVVAAPYDKGRTTTHEVGHYFDLLHVWGNDQNPSCSTDDQITDTPNQDAEIYDCPSSRISCGSNDMISNFLNYTNDACMGNFTEGQKTRMRNALYLSRDSLQYGVSLGLTSIRENTLLSETKIFPNPTTGIFQLIIPQEVPIHQLEIRVVDILGKSVDFRTKNLSNGLEIDLLNVEKGIYFVQLEEGNFSVTKKLIKQ